MTIDVRATADAVHDDLVALRRALHREPEIGNQLPATQARVLAALDGLDLEITTGTSLTSVVAVVRGALPGGTTLLRGDMDALPVDEQVDVDYASTNGAMHACGHDLHTAGLVGAARVLAAHRDRLPGTVVLMFQPGEESPGGADPMIEEGLLEAAGTPIDAAYAIHVAPGTRGTFGTRGGPMLAGANVLRITMHGEGGHGSQPQDARDPVAPLVECCQALQVLVTRRFSVFDPVVLSITNLAAGDAVNVIPPTASMGATVRTLSRETTERFPQLAAELAESIAAAHGCTATVEWTVQYPPTINDPAQTAFAMRVLADEFGTDRVVEMPNAMMASEDFSLVLERVPGAMVMLQASPPDLDPTDVAFNHSPYVVFDDAVLADEAAALAALAIATNAAHAPTPEKES